MIEIKLSKEIRGYIYGRSVITLEIAKKEYIWLTTVEGIW
jgi:hypothetical protein